MPACHCLAARRAVIVGVIACSMGEYRSIAPQLCGLRRRASCVPVSGCAAEREQQLDAALADSSASLASLQVTGLACLMSRGCAAVCCCPATGLASTQCVSSTHAPLLHRAVQDSPSLRAADGWCALALSGPTNSWLPHAVPCCAARCGGAQRAAAGIRRTMLRPGARG